MSDELSNAGASPQPEPPNRSTNWVIGVALALMVLVVVWLAVGAVGPGAGGRTLPTHEGTSTAPPEQIGSSVNGVPIAIYRFGSGPRHFLIIGGIHGDEFGSNVAEALVRDLQARPSVLPSGTEFDVVPSINPDGRAADTRANAHNVDLNRNFPSHNWSAAISSKDNRKNVGMTGGSGPGSEPETQALVKCMDAGHYAVVVTLHSQGGFIDFDGPGGKGVAARVSAATGLRMGHVDYQAAIHGSMGTFVPERYGIPVITMELTAPNMSPRVETGILCVAQ